MGSMSFTATRNLGADLTIPLTIPFTVSGTAVFGTDYSCTGADTFTATSGQLTIPIGSSSATIVVTATPTTVAGLNKSITFTPVAVENKWAIVTSSLPWTGTILNLNQAIPSVSIINNGTTDYSITSNVSSTTPIIINFLREVITGSYPSVISSGTITLPAGVTTVNLARVDSLGTSTEIVVLQAANASSYVLGNVVSATIATIPTPTVALTLNGSVGWIITRFGATTSPLIVNYTSTVVTTTDPQTVNTSTIVINAGVSSANVYISPSSAERIETLTVGAGSAYLLGAPTALSITISLPAVSASSLNNNNGWAIAISPMASTDTVVNITQAITVGSSSPITTNSTVTIPAYTSVINVLATTATTARTEALTILTGTGYKIGTATATLTYSAVLPKATVAVSNDGTGFSINLDLAQLNTTTVNLNRTYTHAGIQDPSTAITVVIPAGSTTIYRSIDPVNTDDTTGSVSLAIAAGSSYNTNIGGSNLGILATVPLPNSQLPIVTVSALADNSGWKFTLSSVQAAARTVNYTLSVTPTSGSPTVTYGSMTINAGALTANVLVSNSTGSRVEALTLALGNSYLPTAPNYVLQTVSIAIGSIAAPISSSNRSSLILNCKFDGANGSTTFIDDYGATIARAGVGNTAISTAQAKFGTGSLYVDGTPLVISDSVGKDKYNFPGQYTVQAWVYISAGTVFDTNSSHLLSRCDNVTGRSTEYAFKLLSTTSLGMYYGIRGANEVEYSATIPTLNIGWNHIAFTRDASNVMRFFANGVLGTGTNSTPTDATSLGNSANNVYIGGFFPPYGLAQGIYIDSLEVDNVCLYNAAFTPPVAPTSAAPAPTPVASASAAGDPLFSKVKALLSFNGDITDRSIAPHTFAMDGSVASYSNSNPFGESTGTSISLNGSTAIKATSSDFVIPASSDFCLEGWVQYTTAPNPSNGYHSPSNQYLLGLDSQAITFGYGTFNSSNSWFFVLNQASPAGGSVVAPIPIAGTWYFWQLQRSAGTIKSYISGVALGSTTDNSAFGSSGELRIGDIISGGDVGYGINGNIAEFRLTVGATRPTVVPTARFPRSAAPIASTPAAGDPLFSSVVLLMPMTTASGITDIKGKVATNQGATQSTAVLDPFGQNAGVVSFPGGGARISVAQSADFAFNSGAFAIEFWAYPTSAITGLLSGLFDVRSVSGDGGWNFSLDANNQIYTNALSTFNGDEPSGKILPIGSWSYVCISRDATTSINRTSINGVGVTSGYNRNPSIISPDNLIIGDIINTVSPYNGSFTGYMSNLRITRAYRDGSIVPTAPFPIT